MTDQTTVRTLWLGGRHEGVAVILTAIPWCTVHKMSALGMSFCHEGFIQDQAEQPITCSVSLGGFNHKWWEEDA